MPTISVTIEPEGPNPTKRGTEYFMVAKFSDGHIRRYLSLPSKIAELLREEGYRLTKVDYFHYNGSKEI